MQSYYHRAPVLQSEHYSGLGIKTGGIPLGCASFDFCMVPIPERSYHWKIESSSLGGEVESAVERKWASDASSQVFRLPIEPGLKSFLLRRITCGTGPSLYPWRWKRCTLDQKYFRCLLFYNRRYPVGKVERLANAVGAVGLELDQRMPTGQG